MFFNIKYISVFLTLLRSRLMEIFKIVIYRYSTINIFYMKHPRLNKDTQGNDYNEIGNLNLAKRFNSLFRLVGKLLKKYINNGE
jgi:hypothetical protein